MNLVDCQSLLKIQGFHFCHHYYHLKMIINYVAYFLIRYLDLYIAPYSLSKMLMLGTMILAEQFQNKHGPCNLIYVLILQKLGHYYQHHEEEH